MKNKRYLRLLVITLVLVVSMFSNVFANTGSGWTCIKQGNTDYSVGERLDTISGISIYASDCRSAYCIFNSNFDVKEGDLLSIAFGSFFSGDRSEFDGSASDCTAQVVSENGGLIATINFELNGNLLSCNERKDVYITKETAGKMKFYIYLECPGPYYVSTELNELYVEINGEDV
jgi:hypothetical protein